LLHEEMTRAIDTMRAAASPGVLGQVRRFTSMQKWLDVIPSLTVSSGIARKLAGPDLQEMGYDIIRRDGDTYKIDRIPFSYDRTRIW
jgi:hypothetical protein